MAGAIVSDFPLFPLGIVALPTELVPLHIFEERYKTMIGRCLEEESEFGIVWVSDDGLKEIGCAMEISEVLERAEDGRMNIVCRGTRVFRVHARQEDLPYPAGSSSWPTIPRRSTPTLARRRRRSTPSWSSRRPTSRSTRSSSAR